MMAAKNNREALISQFLDGTTWSKYVQSRLAGDASDRSYLRLADKGADKSVVFMDAPPENDNGLQSFIRVGRFLNLNGFSAPRILDADEKNGFLILEDFGDDVFARIIAQESHLEEPLYEAAVDALVELHSKEPLQDLNVKTAKDMADLTDVAFDWYLLGATETHNSIAKEAVQNALASSLAEVLSVTPVVSLRDFHSENLIWLSERPGLKKVGLLDFQDAFLCHPAYDLVSLLTDARRDVTPDLIGKMISRYVSATNANEDDFNFAYAALSVQRNLRIIGVFARLSMHFGKPDYIDLLPRVWGYLLKDLEHPRLSSLSELLRANLPSPSKAIIEVLKNKCAIIPTL